jgi:hypothetical protein
VATIKNLIIRIGVTDANVKVGVDRVNRSLDGMASRVEHIQAIGRVGAFSALAGSAIQLGRAFAPATAALGHFAVAAAPAAGAVLALPAAIAVGVGAMATFKVGLLGMGDAMKAMASGDSKKLDAALKKLAPSARQFVTAMGETKKSFEPVRLAVQQKLFAGLAAQMKAVAAGALPGLKAGMGVVATQFNGLAREALGAARTPLFSGTIAKVLGTTASVMAGFRPAVQPLILGLTRLVSLGLPLVRVFGAWAGRMATAGAQMLAVRSEASRFSRTIDKAIGVFRRNGDAAGAWSKAMAQIHIVWGQLSVIGKNVFSVIQSVGRAIQGSTAPSKSLLQLITDLTAKMAVWAKSSEGQKQLSGLFTSLQQVASNLVEILPQLGGVLTLILKLINGLPGPVRDTALQMLAWSIVLSRFTGPISGAIKLIGGTGKAIGILNKVGMGAGKGFAALGKGLGSFGAATGQTAGRFGTAAGNIARTLGSVAASVGRAAASALLSLGRLAVASAITVARVVAGWVLMGVQSLIRAAQMAAAWLIAMGPVGWTIAAVIALVALIIANWDTVKRWTVAAWNAISSAVSTAVGWIVGFIRDHWRLIITIIGGPLGLAVALVTKYWRQILNFVVAAVTGVLKAIGWLNRLPGMVGGWFASMARSAVNNANAMLKRIAGIPGAIGRVFSGAGKWLYNAGRNIMVGLWNGVVSLWNWLVGKFRSLTNLIPHIKGPPERDRRLLTPAGVAIMQSLGAGITSQIPALKRTLAGVTDQIGVSPLALAAVAPAPGGAGRASGQGGMPDARTLAAAIRDALHGTTVQMDSQPVGQIISRDLGQKTSLRRRTG